MTLPTAAGILRQVQLDLGMLIAFPCKEGGILAADTGEKVAVVQLQQTERLPDLAVTGVGVGLKPHLLALAGRGPTAAIVFRTGELQVGHPIVGMAADSSPTGAVRVIDRERPLDTT